MPQMRMIDLGLICYRDAWAIQEKLHAQAAEGGEESLLLLEHHPVITFGRRAADSAKNLIASRDRLEQMGVEVVESDRGGDITFHGPGQLVVYPILRLGDRSLTPGAYVHRLEDAVIAALAEFGIAGHKDAKAPGVWVHLPSAPAADALPLAKICAVGVRIKGGVSLHGIALNLTTDLRYFDLINPCGLSRPVTTMAQLLGDRTPSMPQLKQAVGQHITKCF